MKSLGENKTVTHVGEQKCYLCRWTGPFSSSLWSLWLCASVLRKSQFTLRK